MHRESSGHVYVFGFPVARRLPHEGGRLPTAALISSAADMGRFIVAQLRTDSSELLSAAGSRRCTPVAHLLQTVFRTPSAGAMAR